MCLSYAEQPVQITCTTASQQRYNVRHISEPRLLNLVLQIPLVITVIVSYIVTNLGVSALTLYLLLLAEESITQYTPLW